MTMSRTWSLPDNDSGVGRPSFVAEFGLWNDEQIAAAEKVEAALDDVDLVRVVFGDPHGLARSKTVPAHVFRTVLRNGLDFSPGPFLFDTGHAVAVDFLADPGVGVGELLGAGDFVLVPDPRTFQVLPRGQRRTAWVVGDEYLRDGSPHPLATRHLLHRVCARYAERDLAPVIGLEVEWYLTRLVAGPVGNAGNGFGRQGPAPAVAAMNPGYQFNLDSYYDAVADIADPLAAVAHHRTRIRAGAVGDDFRPDAGAGGGGRHAAVPHPGQAGVPTPRLPRVVHDPPRAGGVRSERLAPASVGRRHDDEPQPVRAGRRHDGPALCRG